MDCNTSGIPVLRCLPELRLTSIESGMPSNHLILCCPLLLLPSIFPSIRVFSNESALLIRWPKDWSFSFSISPSSEYSGFISFRMDWFWSPCTPRDSQESSPAPQFESINSSVLSLHYGSGLTFVHDYWKKFTLAPHSVKDISQIAFLVIVTEYPPARWNTFTLQAYSSLYAFNTNYQDLESTGFLLHQ